MTLLVFDIETVPDTEAGARLYDLQGLSEDDIVAALSHLRRQESPNQKLLRHHLQRIVAISVVRVDETGINVQSLGDLETPEKELIKKFFAGIDYYKPTLISWNGGGFDLPVLHYRAMLHGLTASTYWDVGETKTFPSKGDVSSKGEPPSKWNNYISRYHLKHTDLMDLLSLYQPKATARLDDMAVLLGFPGKLGMDGSQVWPAFQRGELDKIRQYCETDVLNTYLVYLRFQLFRGALNQYEYEACLQVVRDYLAKNSHQPHFKTFLEIWE